MANVSLFYNKGRKKVFLSFTHNGENARRALSASVEPDQWKDGKVINRPDKRTINAYLQALLSNAQIYLLELSTTHRMRELNAAQIRDLVCMKLFGEDNKDSKLTLEELFELKYKDSPTGTKLMASDALKSVHRFTKTNSVLVSDITEDWVYKLRDHMKNRGMSVNTRIMHIGKVQSALTYARKTLKMPIPNIFREIESERPHSRHRSLTLEQTRAFFNAEFDKTGTAYQDVMKLIFMLIGINMKDLYDFRQSDIVNGRIEYSRAKTHKEYSIKIEPEAEAIIRKYHAETKLLTMLESKADWKHKTSTIDMYVSKLSKSLGLPGISTYWMRHTWASIAFNDCNIPSDVISAALGHSYGQRVTMIYINPALQLIDQANRAVLDKVFGA